MSQQTAEGIVRQAIGMAAGRVILTLNVWQDCGREGRRRMTALAAARGVRVNVRLPR